MTRASVLARLMSVLATGALLGGVTAVLPAAADTKMTARQKVNIRTAASTSSTVVGGLVRGQTVSAVSSAGGWTKIRFSKSNGYIATRYLARGTTIAAPVRVAGLGPRVATAGLKLRMGPSTSKKVITTLPLGTRVNATGRSRDGYAEVASTAGRGWMITRYLARATGLPAVVGVTTTTANVNLRSGSEATSKVVATAQAGTTLDLTGIQDNGRSQVLYLGASRWAVTRLLSIRKPVVPDGTTYPVEKGLTERTIALHRACRATWPQITTYYGYRNDPGSDHYTGRGLDIMIPNYTTASGKALGESIATWAVRNQSVFGIQYVIWNQRIWNVSRADEGWRPMSDRGNDSANHLNHVHVSLQE